MAIAKRRVRRGAVGAASIIASFFDRANSRLAPGDDYISADTGMSCKNLGGIGVCGPPHGTVHYRNDKGENCTRTGLVSICD